MKQLLNIHSQIDLEATAVESMTMSRVIHSHEDSVTSDKNTFSNKSWLTTRTRKKHGGELWTSTKMRIPNTHGRRINSLKAHFLNGQKKLNRRKQSRDLKFARIFHRTTHENRKNTGTNLTSTPFQRNHQSSK